MIFQVEDYGRFQTAHSGLKATLKEARKIAATINSVLIIGGPGSGRKELALDIFEHSTRSESRLIHWSPNFERNEDLLSSDTVVIENLEDYSLEEQHKIFEIVFGFRSRGPLKSPRWLTTASGDIRRLVKLGVVNLQLFQVLSSHVLTMPTLEDRNMDILFLAKATVENWNQVTLKTKVLSEEVIQKLQRSSYQNNVLQLFDLIQRAYSQSVGDLILASDFGWHEPSILQAGLPLAEMERRLILQTLEMTKQNRTRAAEILGISIRTLRNKIQEYRGQGLMIQGGVDEQFI